MKTFSGIVLILCSFTASAQPVMQWYTSHWPPYRISEGPYAGQGSFDLMLSQLIDALPQYQHQINQIHLARIVKVSATTSENHCTFGLRYTPERDRRSYFSQPAGLLPNLAVNSLQQHEKPNGSMCWKVLISGILLPHPVLHIQTTLYQKEELLFLNGRTMRLILRN